VKWESSAEDEKRRVEEGSQESVGRDTRHFISLFRCAYPLCWASTPDLCPMIVPLFELKFGSFACYQGLNSGTTLENDLCESSR